MILSNDTSFERVPTALLIYPPNHRGEVYQFEVPVYKLSTPQLYKLVKFFKDKTALDELKKRGVFV